MTLMTDSPMITRESKRFFLTVLTILTASGCANGEDNGTAPSALIHAVNIDPLTHLISGIGNTVSFSATPVDASNKTLTADIEWAVLDSTIVSIDSNGTAKGLKVGTTIVIASAGSKQVSVRIEVWDPPSVNKYSVGQTFQGRKGYAEYIPGDLPLILSAGHGGNLCPNEIPDRTYGTIGRCSSTGSDTNTLPLTTTIRSIFLELTGHAPHIVLLRLARPKLDANRTIVEAAQGSSFAENAWSEYHGFIDAAKDTISKEFGFGLYLDMHGHGHDVPRIELGYLLTKTDLQTSSLDLPYMVNKSSVKTLSEVSIASNPATTTFTDIIRGPSSLGTLLEARGVRAVPSSPDPAPTGNEAFFSGGYSTRRHGSRDGGVIDGVQFEHHYPGLRDTSSHRLSYANKLVEVLVVFLETHYGWSSSTYFNEN